MRFTFEKQAETKIYGNGGGGYVFEAENPILYFSQLDWGSKARAVGFYFYSPDIRDINQIEQDVQNKQTIIKKRDDYIKEIEKKYKDNLGEKTPEQVKADLDALNKRPNTTQEEYNK